MVDERKIIIMKIGLKHLSAALFVTSTINSVLYGSTEGVTRDLVQFSTLVFVFFSAVRYGFVSLCVKLFSGRDTARIAIVSRQATCFIKFLYFVLVASLEFSALRDVPFMPKFLGGTRTVMEMTDSSKMYMKKAPLDVSNLTYGFAIGYHLSSMFYHMYVVERRGDYHEMLLHHWVTLYLTITSLFDMHTAGGSAVMMIHDTADVFVYFSKLMADIPSRPGSIPDTVKKATYVSLIASFFYLRILCYPFVSYASIILFRPFISKFHYWTSTIAMYTLQVHWFVILLKVGAQRKKTGGFVDLSSERGPTTNNARVPDALKPNDSIASTATSMSIASQASLLGSSISFGKLKKIHHPPTKAQ